LGNWGVGGGVNGFGGGEAFEGLESVESLDKFLGGRVAHASHFVAHAVKCRSLKQTMLPLGRCTLLVVVKHLPHLVAYSHAAYTDRRRRTPIVPVSHSFFDALLKSPRFRPVRVLISVKRLNGSMPPP
jgi:hypothetical protein